MARREMKYGNERRFCDNIIYDGSTISQILIDGGYITLNDNGSPIYHFYITDHQGNNRLVVNANGTIEESNTYYPYGALINSTTNIQRYKYNGKELNQHSYMLWYDYMARQTMPILGRFSSVDPLCEKYYGMSPYAYCANNPVKYVDLDGRDFTISIEDGTITIHASYFVEGEEAQKEFEKAKNYWIGLNDVGLQTSDGYNLRFDITTASENDAMNTFKVAEIFKDGGYTGQVPDEKTAGTCDGKNIIINKLRIGLPYTAAHEIGHSLGLVHTTGEYYNYPENLMYWNSGDRKDKEAILVNEQFTNMLVEGFSKNVTGSGAKNLSEDKCWTYQNGKILKGPRVILNNGGSFRLNIKRTKK